MSKPLITRGEHSSTAPDQRHHSTFFNPERLPWTPWVMEGTWFKLLSINPANGGFSMLLKVSPDNHAPVHGHLGSVEGIVLEGGFGYGDDRGRPGWYVHERGGVKHQPDTDPDGMIMFAVAHGPLAGYADDGSVAAVVDARTMFELAAAAGAAGHLRKPEEWPEE